MTYHYPDLDSDTLSMWNFCYRSSDVISQETSCSVGKYRLFSRSPKRTWEEREKVILAMKIIVAGLRIREIHEEYLINSLQPVITTTQRKEIRYCIFINMFLRTENSKRVNIFQHFLYALSRARFNLPLYLVPRSSTATTANLVPPKPGKSALGTRLFHGESGIWAQD